MSNDIQYFVILSILVSGCTNNAVEKETESAVREYPEFQHSSPQTDEALIEDPEKTFSDVPKISVGLGWSDKDKEDMTVLKDVALELISDDSFLGYGSELKSTYSRVWLTEGLGYRDSEKVCGIVKSAEPPLRYVPAAIVPQNGWATTSSSRGNVRIKLNRKLLTRWRSQNVVVRACAVNTMAHEISHTISRDMSRFKFAFTDSGSGDGSARNGHVASYFTGDLALCSYLVKEGRIKPEEIGKCIAVWYKPEGFQSGRCFLFNDSEPIQWPRRRSTT